MLMGETRGLAGEKEFIKCENLSKTFSGEEGDYTVIKDLELSIKENEFVVILGPGPFQRYGVSDNGAVPVAYGDGKCGIWSENGWRK